MKEWTVKQLNEVATVSGGNPAPQGEAPFAAGHLPFIRTSDVGKVRFGCIDETADLLNSAGAAKLRLVPEGSILFPKSGASTFLDHRVITQMDAYVASHLAVIQVDREVLKPRFALFYLSTVRSRDLVQDQDYPSLNLDTIGSIPIPVPPIGDQERIVELLDAAFDAIDTATANAERNVANSVGLFESILSDRCAPKDDWRSQELQEDVKFIDYRGRTPKKTKTGLRLITAKNVRMGFIQQEPQEFVDPAIYESWMTRGIPQLGDVLFTTEAPLGLVAQLDTDERVVFAQRVITLAPDRSRIDPTMLHYVLRSPDVQRRIHDDATGATATGIKASLLKRIQIALPRGLDDQHRIAQELAEAEDRCRALGEIERRKAEEYVSLRASVLSQAMSGGMEYTGVHVSRANAQDGL